MAKSESTSNKDLDLQGLLRKLPAVDSLIEQASENPDFTDVPRMVLVKAIREAIGELRDAIRSDPAGSSKFGTEPGAIMNRIGEKVRAAMSENLVRLVNATGVVVHTNLGRSLLAEDAIRHVAEAAARYSNLEFDIATGKRGSRYTAVEDILCEVSGAEAGMAVNNNAAAVLLALDTLAAGREVIVSRGELVEIGGSFRIPDIMARSGGILREVGTTNRTHFKDYEQAINDNTGLLLKVHTSNYAIVGFSASVPLTDLVKLGIQSGLPVMEDLGSGTFVDFKKYGLMKEPTVQESVAAGVDLVTFSGDKLLGGPQAGILLGTREIMEKIKKNPLTRAFRIDKLTLAALETTLRFYRDESTAIIAIPTLYMLTCPIDHIRRKAESLYEQFKRIDDKRIQSRLIDSVSKAGGGSFPLLEIPTKCVGIQIEGLSAARIDKRLRNASPPIIGRIEEDVFIMDMRTVMADEIDIIYRAVSFLLD
jgi:L-seryl-tRNA(Ser) seleniumtransferase